MLFMCTNWGHYPIEARKVYLDETDILVHLNLQGKKQQKKKKKKNEASDFYALVYKPQMTRNETIAWVIC